MLYYSKIWRLALTGILSLVRYLRLIYFWNSTVFLKKIGQPWPHFVFSFFSNTNFTEKIVGFSGFRTRIVGVEGEHADHLTTTTAHQIKLLQ